MGLINWLSIGPLESPLDDPYDTDPTVQIKSNQELREAYKSIGDIDKLEYALQNKISLGSPTNYPADYGYYYKGNMIYRQDGTPVNGVTVVDRTRGPFRQLSSKTYISPGVKGISSNGISFLHKTLNHELLHAWHIGFSQTPFAFNQMERYSESATRAYDLDYAKANGMTLRTQNFFKEQIIFPNYPQIYHWKYMQRILNINMGIPR